MSQWSDRVHRYVCILLLNDHRQHPQARESHLFKGTEQPVKEYDCVLIYDEDLGVGAWSLRLAFRLKCITL